MWNRVSPLRTCLVIWVVFITGCSGSLKEPELGTVKGTATLDGQPGANLQVLFEPQASGGSKSVVGGVSSAITDSNGKYELIYKGTTKGAVVGQHIVRVSSAKGGGPAGGQSAEKQIVIPPQYNENSTLKKEVKKGDNTIDLEVKTK